MGSSQSTPRALVESISKALGGDTTLFAFPSKALFKDHDAKPYNQDIPTKPAVVTYPKTTAQVAAIVKVAVEAGLKVQPRCGGHSYANYCIPPQYPKAELRLKQEKQALEVSTEL